MNTQSKKFLTDFFAGGTAGIISKTICAPIQRVKLLIQTQAENQRLKGKNYNGIVDCFTRCVKQDGFSSLWRGNGVNVIRYFPTQALNFSFKDHYARIFKPYNKSQQKHSILMFNILCGGCAGSSTTIFVHPLDFARTRLGVDIGKQKSQRQFTGLGNCLTKTYAADGIKGLYRGLFVALGSIFIYRGLYFGIYDTGKEILLKDNNSIVLKLFWAQASVIIAQTISYPGDTIKRKLMMQSLKKTKQYSNFWQCCKTIYQRQGMLGFFKGSLSNILRGVGSSICLVLYDQIKKMSEQHHSKE